MCVNRIGSETKITCAQVECAELFNSQLYKCVKETTLKNCCANKYICEEEEIAKYKTCEYNGVTYQKGSTIYPTRDSCYKCLCDDNFDNSTYIGNPLCKEIDCGISLRYTPNLQKGCIPIYYGNDQCCPIDWKCRKLYNLFRKPL